MVGMASDNLAGVLLARCHGTRLATTPWVPARHAVARLRRDGLAADRSAAEREAVGPPTFPAFGPPDDASEADADAFWLALLTSHDAPRVNVYHHRSSKPEEPS